MAYEVLARKWRPQRFEDVVGQEHVVKTLRNAIERNRIAQAYLLAGPRGTGKTTLARIFAKALNCKNGPTAEPCGACDSCREIAAGSSMAVTEIDGASNNKVEDVHTCIIDKINFMPPGGKFSIYYIDEVHMLTPNAFNALLKTLEEPPPHAKFIFATTEADKVLGTILSRCQRFDLRRISIPAIVGQLRVIADAEGISVEDDALLAIARGADGGMRDAESAFDQMIAFTGSDIKESDVLGVFGLVARGAIESLAGAVLGGDVAGILRLVATFDDSGKDLRKLVAELLAHFRNLLVCIQLGGDTSGLDLTDAQAGALKAQAGGASAAAALAVVEILIELEAGLRNAFSQRVMTEAALIRGARASSMSDLESILKALTGLADEGALDTAPAAPQERQSASAPLPPEATRPPPPPWQRAPRSASASAAAASDPEPAPQKKQAKTADEPEAAIESASEPRRDEVELNQEVMARLVVKEAEAIFESRVEKIIHP